MSRDLPAITRHVAEALERLSRCDLCPRRCSVDRTAGQVGHCRIGRWAKVASYGPHFGEESPLVGKGGSGTIFFSGCNLDCCYCQNWEISHEDQGEEVGAEELASIMLALQGRGCANINLVSPSHVPAQCLEALALAFPLGLHIPVVYNSGGYDSVEALLLLEGAVDIYMPDMKYASDATAGSFSGAWDYVACNRAAVQEMHRQVGDLVVDAEGVACRGLLVRHLVLPGGVAGSAEVMAFLAGEISTDTYVNIMAQYRPAGEAHLYPELAVPAGRAEYLAAVTAAHAAGLHRLDR